MSARDIARLHITEYERLLRYYKELEKIGIIKEKRKEKEDDR